MSTIPAMEGLSAAAIGLLMLQQTVATRSSVLVPVSRVEYSLERRYDNAFVNGVFADNILLTLAYLRGIVTSGKPVDWALVRAPFSYRFALRPGEVFAFHDRVLPEYKEKVAVTTDAHFNSKEGFRSDGYLVGDGVCHLASFMNIAARNAGLTVHAPRRHDFAAINGVPKEFGVTIYYDPDREGMSALKNLYITNTKGNDIGFSFDYRDKTLSISVSESL